MPADVPAAARADFEAAALGLALPPAAASALRAASELRGEPEPEHAALMRAQAAAPDHPAVLIALYRYHFYGHRLHAAREIAQRALRVGAAALALPAAWRAMPPRALTGASADGCTRFYLFALKGYAYLSLRLGESAEAGAALALLRALDPDDCVGGALIEAVRLRALAGASDLDEGGVVHTGAAAWAQLPPLSPGSLPPPLPRAAVN
jgi:hypothetical protein